MRRARSMGWYECEVLEHNVGSATWRNQGIGFDDFEISFTDASLSLRGLNSRFSFNSRTCVYFGFGLTVNN